MIDDSSFGTSPTVDRATRHARRLGLWVLIHRDGNNYSVEIRRPRIEEVKTVGDQFDNAESLWLFGDRRQVRRIEWRTLAGIKVIRAADVPTAISAVAL